jgi:hypothetical protein
MKTKIVKASTLADNWSAERHVLTPIFYQVLSFQIIPPKDDVWNIHLLSPENARRRATAICAFEDELRAIYPKDTRIIIKSHCEEEWK